MFFLQPLFDQIEARFGEVINHFYLIELIFYSLDRTILYFVIWISLRMMYLFFVKKADIKENLFSKHEWVLNIFVFYVLLLVHLTVFREQTSILNVSIHRRSLSEINWHPLVHTIKLTHGISLFSYYYNFYGNILWFIPMGFGAAYLLKERYSFLKALGIGFSVSILIETMQFLFDTGISDIDDVLFNTAGTIIGILLFSVLDRIIKRRKRKTLSHE